MTPITGSVFQRPMYAKLWRQMNTGHQLRKGHSLKAVLVSRDLKIWQIRRFCC